MKYDKIVRDKIPEIIKENGQIVKLGEEKQQKPASTVNHSQVVTQQPVNTGAHDQYGNYYAPSGENLVDPRTGTFLNKVAGGFINTRTGEFMPAH